MYFCSRHEHLVPLDFEILSEKICQLFPTETKSTYYIPRVPGTRLNKAINAKGKLIDKYRNLKRSYNQNELDNDISNSESEQTSTDITNIGNLLS